MNLPLIPGINLLVNKGEDSTSWYNFFKFMRDAIGTGQVTNGVRVGGATGINLPSSNQTSMVRISGNGSGTVVITANPSISQGFDGQSITIEGTDDTNKVTLNNGNGIKLNGGASFTFAKGDIMNLHYSNISSCWLENYRSKNS